MFQDFQSFLPVPCRQHIEMLRKHTLHQIAEFLIVIHKKNGVVIRQSLGTLQNHCRSIQDRTTVLGGVLSDFILLKGLLRDRQPDREDIALLRTA